MSLITLVDSYGKEMAGAKINEGSSLIENSDHIKRLINVVIERAFKRELTKRDNYDQKHSLMSQTIAEDVE